MKSRSERPSSSDAFPFVPVVVAAAKSVAVAVILGALSSSTAAAFSVAPPPLSVPSFRPAPAFPVSSRSSLLATDGRRRAKTTALFAKASQLPILEDWKLDKFDRIVGTVYDHPSIDDGDVVTTSPLSNPSDAVVNAAEEGESLGAVVTTTSGSRYRLGSMRRNASVVAAASPSPSRKRSTTPPPRPSPRASPPRSKTVETSSGPSSSSGRRRRRRVSPIESAPVGAPAVPTLNGWSITRLGGRSRVTGTITGHPNYDDGEIVTTSPLLSVDSSGTALLAEGSVVTTSSGSKYLLGKATKRASAPGGPKAPFSGFWPSLSKPKETSDCVDGVDEEEEEEEDAPTAPPVVVPPPSNRENVPVNPTIERVSLPERKRLAKIEYDLTGDKCGQNGKYLLSGKSYRSTSGKSTIYAAYQSDDDDLPTGKSLAIKVCSNVESLTREKDNYDEIESLGSRYVNRFVKRIEYLPRWDGPTFAKYGAIVVEAGTKDLKEVLAERRSGDEEEEEGGKKGGGGGLDGVEMRDAAYAAALCVQAVHAAGLVWTDLKPENFVVLPSSAPSSDGSDGNDDERSEPKREEVRRVRGIDLESAIPIGDTPVDYSPEACPPEFARAFLEGEGLDFVLNKTYDVWSLGMLLYELSTGTSYFDGMTPKEITERLSEEGFRVDVAKVKRFRLRNLIERCLQVDPRKRPSIEQVLLHPYFVTTKMGWL